MLTYITSLITYAFSSLVLSYVLAAVEDDNSTASQGKGLRDLLIESAELIDPEKAIDFLKSSVKFRLLYCFLPNFNPSSPMNATKETESDTTEGVSLRGSSEIPEETGPRQVMNDLSDKEKEPALLKEFVGPPDASHEINSKNMDFEKKLSSDHINDLKQPVADNQLKEPLTSKTFSGAQSTNPGINSESTESEKTTVSNAILSSENVDNVVADTHLKKPLTSHKHNRLKSTNQFNLDESDSKKTSSKNDLADKTKMMVLADTDHKNENSVVETSDRVGKAELQENSDEGEFSSVTRINYNEVAFKDQKRELVGVEMGFVV